MQKSFWGHIDKITRFLNSATDSFICWFRELNLYASINSDAPGSKCEFKATQMSLNFVSKISFGTISDVMCSNKPTKPSQNVQNFYFLMSSEVILFNIK